MMPKNDPLDAHFAAIRQIDARAEQEAKRIRAKLAWQEREFKANHWQPAKDAGERIRRIIRTSLRPHRVEMGHGRDWIINYTSMTVLPSIDFEVWPDLPGADRFATQARTPIKVSVTPRDAAELRRVLAAVKDAADRLALMLYTTEGKA
jgi:hypothetical protein